MDWLLNVITNRWTISILTGIISSVLAHLGISLYTRRKANKVRLQKISTANNEILYVLRPLVVDSKMPAPNLLRSLINATARKYSLLPSDLYSPEVIVENLTKEILENMFLSTQDKLKLCEDFDSKIVRNNIPEKRRDAPDMYIMESRITMLTSMVIAMITMVATMMTLTNKSDKLNINSDFIQVYAFIIFGVSVIMLLLRIMQKKRFHRAKSVPSIVSNNIDTEHKKDIIEYERVAKKLDESDVQNAWVTYKTLGIYYANIQRNEVASQYYAKAIAVFPSVNQDKDAIGELYILRGGILKRLGVDSFTDAISSIKKGLKLVDNDHLKGDAYYNLACMYAKLDEKEKFNNILQQNLSQLDEKERVIVRQRVEHWLKNNAADYLTELS